MKSTLDKMSRDLHSGADCVILHKVFLIGPHVQKGREKKELDDF